MHEYGMGCKQDLERAELLYKRKWNNESNFIRLLGKFVEIIDKEEKKIYVFDEIIT